MPSIRCVFVFHTTCYFCNSRMSKVLYRIASSGNGKYIGPPFTSQGRAEPLRARIKGANREVSTGKADV